MKYTISIKGKESKECEEGKNLMASLHISCGYVPKGCHNGGCGICRIKIHKGDFTKEKMNKRHIGEAEEAKNIFLACKIFPKSDMEIEFIRKEKPKHYCLGDNTKQGE